MHTSDLPTVLLRHVLPDGSSHFDWMFAPDASPASALVTFRVDQPIHHPEVDLFDAEMIGRHRREYLTFQGPISGNRGSVQRVVSGLIRIDELTDAGIRVRVDWPAGARFWIGTPLAGNIWRFVVDPISGR